MFASHPGHTCSRLGRKDEAASKDACHAPAAPPALEPRGWLPHRGGLLHLLAGTLRDHLDNCFSALFGSAWSRGSSLYASMLPLLGQSFPLLLNTHSSTHRDSSCVSPAPPVCGCTAARLPGNSWHYNPCSPALQFFHKPPPNVCLLVTAGVALWCQVGHPRHLASCPIAGVSSGYRFGVSFWWSVFSRSGAV